MTGTSLGFVAFTLVALPGARWLWLMQRVQIPADRTFYIATSAAAVPVGIAAFVLGTTLAGGMAAGLAILGGSVFVALCSASAQANTKPAVSVGSSVVEFTAVDDNGQPFPLARLRGRPFLLKFFRGHWCPYCVAELRRWEELRPELAARGIEVVTICSDTPEQIRRGRSKHGLGAVMLSDPKLAITDLYNLRNPKSFAPKPGVIIPLPIPTTILVDAGGIVRWIDQSTDYMVRSEPGRVLAAIRQTLDSTAPTPVPNPVVETESMRKAS